MEERFNQGWVSIERRLDARLQGLSEDVQEAATSTRERHKALESKLGSRLEEQEPRMDGVIQLLGEMTRGQWEAKEDLMVVYREVTTIEAIMEGVVSSKVNRAVASLRATLNGSPNCWNIHPPHPRGAGEGRGKFELRKAGLNSPPAGSTGHGARPQGGSMEGDPIVICTP